MCFIAKNQCCIARAGGRISNLKVIWNLEICFYRENVQSQGNELTKYSLIRPISCWDLMRWIYCHSVGIKQMRLGENIFYSMLTWMSFITFFYLGFIPVGINTFSVFFITFNRNCKFCKTLFIIIIILCLYWSIIAL